MCKTKVGNFRRSIACRDESNMKTILDSIENKEERLCVLNSAVFAKIPNLFLAMNMNAGRPTILKFLLDNGADINIKFGINTPLINEVKFGNSENISMLLKYGADIYVKDEYGNDALYYARHFQHKKIVKLITKKHSKNKAKLRKLLYNGTRDLDLHCIGNIIEYIYKL